MPTDQERIEKAWERAKKAEGWKVEPTNLYPSPRCTECPDDGLVSTRRVTYRSDSGLVRCYSHVPAIVAMRAAR